MSKEESAEELFSEESSGLFRRDMSRWMRYAHARAELVQYFRDLGDTKTQAKNKVRQLSREISDLNKEIKLDYITGDKQPLKDAINASTLTHMTIAAKTTIVSKL